MQIDAAVAFEFASQEIDDAQVKVFTTQESIAVGGQYFELMFAFDFGNFDDGNIESTAAQVIDRNGGIAFRFVHTKRQGRRSRLVDNTFDVQTSDTSGVFSRLTLRVVEVSRHGNNRFGDFFAQKRFSVFFQLHQHPRRHFRWCHFFTVAFHPGVAVVGFHDFVRHHFDVFLHRIFFKAAADQTFDRKQSVFRIGHRLAFGGLTDQHFVVAGKGDDGRRGARAFAVFDNPRGAVFQYCDAGVSGS